VFAELGKAGAERTARAGRQLGPDVLHRPLGGLHAGAGQAAGELVAAPADHQVVRPQAPPQGGGHLAEDGVAGVVPQAVVDAF
jgi:hypothetical protein